MEAEIKIEIGRPSREEGSGWAETSSLRHEHGQKYEAFIKKTGEVPGLKVYPLFSENIQLEYVSPLIEQ